jgi:alpha-tubulin suppressor-like RCC1 family protein
LTEEGKIYSWGYNEFGEMGTGKTSQEPQTPQLVKGRQFWRDLDYYVIP